MADKEFSRIIRLLKEVQCLREVQSVREVSHVSSKLLKLREKTEKSVERLKMCDHVYPKKLSKILYKVGDKFDCVLREANDLVRFKYCEKSQSYDCICVGTVADPLSFKRVSHTEPLCSTYKSEEMDLSITGRSESTDANEKVMDCSDLFAYSKSKHSSTEDGDYVGLLETLNICNTPFQEWKHENIVESDSSWPSNNIEDSSDSESTDEDLLEYDRKLIRSRMGDMLKFFYGRLNRNEMGKTYYWNFRPERRNNNFKIFPDEKPVEKNGVEIKQNERKMLCKSSEKDKQNTDINNGITLLTVKDHKELNRSNSHFGKHAKRTLIKEIKSPKSNSSAISMSSTNSLKLRQTKRKISAKSSSPKLTNQPDKSSAKSSTSSRKQKGQFGNKHKKPISSTELPVKKLRKICRNVSHSAKQTIIKSTKVPQSKPSRLQFSSTLKPPMKECNLFLSEELTSVSDQGTVPRKSTRISMKSSNKVKLQSSRKSLSFLAGGDESSGNVSKKTKQEQATSSKLSVQKLCSQSKLNVSTALQNKRKPVKDSSVQQSEAKVGNISQTSKSVSTKKRKAESDNPSVTRQLRSMSKKCK